MIDRETRDKYAELLRHFAAGQLTNDDYDDQTDKVAFKDDSVNEIYDQMWFTYCDLRTHKLTGKDKLTAEGRKVVARFIMFLYSDFSYEWPRSNLGGRLLNLLSQADSSGMQIGINYDAQVPDREVFVLKPFPEHQTTHGVRHG